MPTWLNHSREHLAKENLEKLRRAMLDVDLSDDDVSVVASAIIEASNRDPNKVAGTAEFCLILVETMEMGVSSLVAAAAHFNDCVIARERSVYGPLSTHNSLSFWEHHEMFHDTINLEPYGIETVSIARDVAQLKRAETIASSFMQHGRIAIDRSDASNLRKFLLTETGDWRALAIRSAACLFRLRGLIQARGNSKAPLTSEEVSVSREALSVYAKIASQLGMYRLKNELEGAAFRLLYRRQYEMVTSLTDHTYQQSGISTGDEMRNVLDEVTEQVNAALREDQTFNDHVENFQVTARVKEPFSLWKKMLRLGVNEVLKVPDALALRVIVNAKKHDIHENDAVTRSRDRAVCYYAQKICTESWNPLAENPRFKDYIKHPKVNGYQSLHYTAQTFSNNQVWPFEVQVRSGQMHRVAEFGFAAHWEYKEKSGEKSKKGYKLDHSTDAYLKAVQEWHWSHRAPSGEKSERISNRRTKKIPATNSQRTRASAGKDQRFAPYIEALAAAQSSLARENVFVFLSSSPRRGKLLALPAGACVLDALRVAEQSLGLRYTLRGSSFESVVRNGRASHITQQLRNGDVVAVPVGSVP